MREEPSYIEIISEKYPTIQCASLGDGSDYSALVWQSGPALPPQAELDAHKAEMETTRVWKHIQQERDTRKAGGVKVGTDWFHSDDASRIQQLGLLMFGASMPAGIMWKTMAGTFVPMTPTLAGQIFAATATNDQAIFTRAEIHKATMMASPDPTMYDYSTGWPLTYGE